MPTNQISIRPMTLEEYDVWAPASIRNFAADKIRSGNWSAEESGEKSRKMHLELLPHGVKTEGHQFYTIVDAGDANYGMLWIFVRPEEKPAQKQAFIYDIEINSEHRGQGIGSKAMAALEETCRNQNIGSINLHVFGHNPGARKLYNRLGFEETNIQMRKIL